MCGIVGVLGPAGIDTRRVEVMRDQLLHRGPDHGGLWVSGDGTACLGHRRLAIIDLHAEANQPFLSADGRFAITFNGEIYNFKLLAHELSRHGVRFRTQSDTEVLIEAYRHWGAACLERLSGMFAFAIWDARERLLFCARDRAGEKPFYYAEHRGTFLFGSELKALVAWPELPRRLNHSALIDFLTFGFVADPKSIWLDCSKLPPGQWMSVQMPEGQAPVVSAPVTYWDFTFAPDDSVTDWGEPIRSALATAAAEMTVADVPVGTFLSGGVDSSAVTAALARAGHAPRTFTVGFDEVDYDERPWARRVADLYQTEHHECVVSDTDAGAVVDRLIWHYDEPFGDYSNLPTYYLCREARRSITVALSGDGGDEVFGGYRRYERLGVREVLRRWKVEPLARAGATMATYFSTDSRRRMLAQYAASPSRALADTLSLGFTQDSLTVHARGELAVELRNYAPIDLVKSHLRHAPPEKVGLVNAMRYLDLKLTLAGGILVKVDRASMAVALEVRPVFLHRDILALAGQIPSRLLAGPGRSKEALKLALRPWLPENVLRRRKQGFALPLPVWRSRDQVRALHEGHVAGAAADMLDADRLGVMAQDHCSGRRNHTAALHNVGLLNRWLQTWQ